MRVRLVTAVDSINVNRAPVKMDVAGVIQSSCVYRAHRLLQIRQTVWIGSTTAALQLDNVHGQLRQGNYIQLYDAPSILVTNISVKSPTKSPISKSPIFMFQVTKG